MYVSRLVTAISLTGGELAQDPQQQAPLSGPNQAADPNSEGEVPQDMPHMMGVGSRERVFRSGVDTLRTADCSEQDGCDDQELHPAIQQKAGQDHAGIA